MQTSQHKRVPQSPYYGPGLMALYKLGLRAAATDTYRSPPPHWSGSARAAYIRGYRDGVQKTPF